MSSDVRKGEVVLYKNRFEVRLVRDTVWLTQKQMAELFNKNVKTINEHIINLYRERELEEKRTIRNFRIVQKEGERNVSRKVTFYNLDVIISIGYRVQSKKGTRFRIWATQVLRKHLIEGYTLNEQRLQCVASKYRELQKAVSLIGNVACLESVSQEARGIAQVIAEYSRALDILDDFDHERLRVPKQRREELFELTYEDARKIIAAVKEQFGGSSLVGQEKDKSFRSSVRTIYQTFGGKDLYPTVQEKAANLLYFVAKNHSFVDGNKRIAAALFICFLEKNKLRVREDGTKRIDDNALVALTLMIAASSPSEKDTMVKVILNVMA